MIGVHDSLGVGRSDCRNVSNYPRTSFTVYEMHQIWFIKQGNISLLIQSVNEIIKLTLILLGFFAPPTPAV